MLAILPQVHIERNSVGESLCADQVSPQVPFGDTIANVQGTDSTRKLSKRTSNARHWPGQRWGSQNRGDGLQDRFGVRWRRIREIPRRGKDAG